MKIKSESILVVPREALSVAGLIPAGAGLYSDRSIESRVAAVVATHRQFLPRDEMERDESYKQIIPYMVFVHERRVFMMQRSGSAGEQRLAHAYTLGIGGHVRESDVVAACQIAGKDGVTQETLVDWGRREFAEEIAYDGGFAAITLLGLVNDESNAVGRVHLGLVYVLHATTDVVAVRSELKSGELMDRQQCEMVYTSMESWSQCVFDALVRENII